MTNKGKVKKLWQQEQHSYRQRPEHALGAAPKAAAAPPFFFSLPCGPARLGRFGRRSRFQRGVDKYTLNVYNSVARGEQMKRRDLVKLFERNGWYFKREGGNHDIYTNGIDCEPISRQVEIKEHIAKKIIKRRALK